VDLKSIVDDTVAVVRSVPADRYDDPTPCSDWTVRTLANHLLQVAEGLRLAGQDAAVPDELWTRDLMSPDWADRFEETAHAGVAAWAEPPPGGTVAMAGSDLPAPMVAAMLASDLILHGWDLARATGQRFDSAHAEVALGFLAGMAEPGRAMGLFGEPVEVAGTAPALDRALGLSGRDPQWTPPAGQTS